MEAPILVLGGNGQIGSELCSFLSKNFNDSNLIISDVMQSGHSSDRIISLDILDKAELKTTVVKYSIKTIINLAAVLSAKGESNPGLAWNVNVDGLINILNIARDHGLKVFHPSSIAVFGVDVEKDNIPQDFSLLPRTMYGASKAAGEALCEYYFRKYSVDVRSIRLPGVISAHSMPGGGTTDYAVEIYHEAVKKGSYTCYLNSDTTLPMLYMDDAIQAIVGIMNTSSELISIHRGYNINGMSIDPNDIGNAIRLWIKDFSIDFESDYRQSIADHWPASLNDDLARKDWGWQPKYNLENMTSEIIRILKEKYNNK